MKYMADHEIGDIASIYYQIFLSPFPEEDYQSKIKKGYNIIPVKFLSDNRLAGFCFLIDKREESALHCWIGGVLPDFRKKGVFSGFIKWVIDYAHKERYGHITLNTDNNKPDIIRMLVKFGFDIIGVGDTVYGDGKKIMFRYDVNPQRKMRLSITDSCNMNCFFCHSEGNYIAAVNKMPVSAIEQLMIQAKKLNFTEITITGGEPLTYPEGVNAVISSCNRWVDPPVIKICTNGMLLDENSLRSIKEYKGKAEFNISLHTVCSEAMAEIVGVNAESTVYNRLFRRLNALNMDFRVNSVILKGINDSEKAFTDYFNYGFDNDIRAVHLLELLVTKEQKELIKYYESIYEIEEKIRSLSQYFRIDTDQKTNKKISLTLYRNDKPMKVVLYRLSCRCGCDHCSSENDVKIGADMCLHPCYLDQEANCGNAVTNLKQALIRRDEFMSSKSSSYSDGLLYWGE